MYVSWLLSLKKNGNSFYNNNSEDGFISSDFFYSCLSWELYIPQKRRACTSTYCMYSITLTQCWKVQPILYNTVCFVCILFMLGSFCHCKKKQGGGTNQASTLENNWKQGGQRIHWTLQVGTHHYKPGKQTWTFRIPGHGKCIQMSRGYSIAGQNICAPL